MDTGTALAITGILLSVLALYMTLHMAFGARESDRRAAVEVINSKISEQATRMDRLIEAANSTVKELDGIRSAFPSQPRPEIPLLATAQWRFVERLVGNHIEKDSICRKIVANYISDSQTIFIDSGSTTGLLPSAILDTRLADISILTNNVFAALRLAGTSTVTLRLLPGTFDQRFGAVFSEAANVTVSDCFAHLFVIAATGLSLDQGIMVDREDVQNATFKRHILDGFSKRPNSKLIIAVDPSKFVVSTDQMAPVVEPHSWLELLKTHKERVFVVTCPIPDDFSSGDRNRIQAEIQRFVAHGVAVDTS